MLMYNSAYFQFVLCLQENTEFVKKIEFKFLMGLRILGLELDFRKLVFRKCL